MPFIQESALEIYCMEMLLHIYFCTHYSVINAVVTTSVEEKFHLALNLGLIESYF